MEDSPRLIKENVAGASLPTTIVNSTAFSIKDIIDPTFPLLEANRAAIESIERKTASYGTGKRHKVIVHLHSPPRRASTTWITGLRPILVFFYGGGFTQGSRIGTMGAPHDLIHTNLGSFFASRGLITIIPDYRLVDPNMISSQDTKATNSEPSFIFPQGAEDLQGALNWVITDPEQALAPTGANLTNIYILAHSAGGTHLSTLLLSPKLFTSALHSAVQGITFLGVPYEPSPSHKKFYEASLVYYGSAKGVSRNNPLSLLRRAEGEWIASLPKIRNVLAESESKALKGPSRTFTREWLKKGGHIEELTLQGHDHMSPVLTLGSGTGEDWGEDVIRWANQ